MQKFIKEYNIKLVTCLVRHDKTENFVQRIIDKLNFIITITSKQAYVKLNMLASYARTSANG